MAALKSDPDRARPKTEPDDGPLARVLRDFDDAVHSYETGLLRSLDDAPAVLPEADHHKRRRRADVRHEACRLALAELAATYTRKQMRRSLHAAEAHARRVEQQLHAQADAGGPPNDEDLCAIHQGYFRLYSTELFDLLGQPTDLRLGTLRFHRADPLSPDHHRPHELRSMSVELALADAFFVADAMETLPYHSFKVPQTPSLQNRGILSRKPEDNGAFPDYDSWLLFTFLGNGCLKLEVPIEMCADIYGGPLRGRENEEIHFWGVFVDDDAP